MKGQVYKQVDPVGIIEGLTSPKYRFASWNAQIIAKSNIMTGIIAVMIYQTKIYLDLKAKGKFDFPIIWAVIIITFVNFLVAFIVPKIHEMFS